MIDRPDRIMSLAELIKDGPIAGYVENAFVVEWSEQEKRWIEVSRPKRHWVKFPGEPWTLVSEE